MVSTPAPTGEITLAASEVAELVGLLGDLEDWLLHASAAATDDLAAFLHPRQGPDAAQAVIDALGAAGVELTRLLGHRP